MAALVTPSIILKKRKCHAEARRECAWKVAYADFITALMALFIVLWLMNASQEVQKAVGGYFRNPRGTGIKMGSAMGTTAQTLTLDRTTIDLLIEKLRQAVLRNPKFEKLKNNIQITAIGDGLRIEFRENANGIFFQNANANPTDLGKALIMELAKQFSPLPNSIVIEGHTDAKPFAGRSNYTNWELSADRANATRKLLQQSGVRLDQVVQIRGYADHQLRFPEKPDDPSNRRVSIILLYRTPARGKTTG